MQLKALMVIAAFFIVGYIVGLVQNSNLFSANSAPDSEATQSIDSVSYSNYEPILNLDNYSRVVSDAIVYANDRLSEHGSRTKALGTHTSVFSSDALRGHSVVLSASTLLTTPKANTSYYSDP